MKRVLSVVFFAVLIALNPLGATAQQVPFLPELVSRFEQFNRLYAEKRQAGADLSAIEALRKRGEQAFLQPDVPALLEIWGEGIALMEGKKWDDRQKFISSLTFNTNRVVVVTNQDLQFSLEQMFRVDGDKVFGSTPAVTFEIVPASPADPSIPAELLKPQVIGERVPLGETITNANRRMRLPDGVYWAVARIESGGRVVAEIKKPVYAISDFNERIADDQTMIAAIKNSTVLRVKAFAGLVTTPEYQLQRLAELNQSTGEVRIDVPAEFDRIEAELAALGNGQNPFTDERGEVERAYRAPDGRLVPYRVYVPKSYDGKTPFPLVVLLHGVLGDERTYFSGLYDPAVIKGEAERRGYLLAAPKGGGRLGGYFDQGLADVFEVIKDVDRNYEIEESRIYLTGNSLGGLGTWTAAAQNPEMFAAIAPVSGGSPAQPQQVAAVLEKVKALPALVVHGARDGVVPPALSRAAVASAQKAGMKATYLEAPEADNISVVAVTFPAVMDFFDKNAKQAPPKQEHSQ